MHLNKHLTVESINCITNLKQSNSVTLPVKYFLTLKNYKVLNLCLYLFEYLEVW